MTCSLNDGPLKLTAFRQQPALFSSSPFNLRTFLSDISGEAANLSKIKSKFFLF